MVASNAPLSRVEDEEGDGEEEGEEEEEEDEEEEDEEEPQSSKLSETTKGIFEYYSMKAQRLHETRLSSSGFVRFTLDANIIDGSLTSAKVDLIFSSLCNGAPTIGLAQFRDGLVRLAAAKFPGVEAADSVLKLYKEHLANFSGPGDECISSIDEKAVQVLTASRQGLQTLYEGYFKAETKACPKRTHTEQTKPVNLQGVFVQILRDFDVEPKLVTKPMIFAVFRQVSLIKAMPASFRQAVMGDAASRLGRTYTYPHFAASLAILAQRCFGEGGSASLIRLLSWMDDSKGRMAFSAAHPGLLSQAGTQHFRLLPQNLPDGCDDRRKSVLAIAPAPASKPNMERRSSLPGTAALPVSDSTRRLLRQTFEFYSHLGGPLNGLGLGSVKFHRFLRDAGLLSSEGTAVSTTVSTPMGARMDFMPGDRVGSSVAASDAMRRCSSAGRVAVPLRSAPRPSVTGSTASPRYSVSSTLSGGSRTGRRESISFTVSSPARPSVCASGSLAPGSSLPLRVFPKPVLTTVEADLMFMQTTRTTGPVKRSSGSVVDFSVKRKTSAGAENAPRHQLTADDFAKVLAKVATKSIPGAASPHEALDEFSKKVLEPLVEILLGDKAADVVKPAVEFVQQDDKLLPSCSEGLKSVFQYFAENEAKPRWTKESFARFLQEFGLTPEIAYITMQNIFRCCAEHESGGKKSLELPFSGFSMLIVLLAIQIMSNEQISVLDKVTHLLSRMNATIMRGQLKICIGVHTGDIFPVRDIVKSSGRASLATPSPGGARRSLTSTPGSERRESLSWANVVEPRGDIFGEDTF
eukprot:TRINITY_DN4948_c0_g1_i1.p1 TRINITY_DN4948_c0_g1~~TRINITY_DN4948_c0_g1_i1.p1  ORF type:complete len:806 (+),score=138.64 TRINITY_DN4948_c0_g1_i1:56-2473(+)